MTIFTATGLVVDDIKTWLAPVGITTLSADTAGTQPGEQIIIDLSSTGSRTGGEGQFRSVNFNLSVAARSADALEQYAVQIDGIIPADFRGKGTWPVADESTKVFFVDYAAGSNGWQRRPIDAADRHCGQAFFTATYAQT